MKRTTAASGARPLPDAPRAPFRRRTRAEAKVDTRRRLLDAARAVFLRLGFHAATVDQVAEEAGFTKGAVYSTFASKADLFLALYEERIDQRREELERTAGPAPVGDARARISRSWKELLQRDRAWHLALVEFWAFAARDDALRSRFAALQGRTRAMLLDTMPEWRSAKGDGSARARDRAELEVRMRAQVALGNGFLLEGFSDPGAAEGYPRARDALDRGLDAAFRVARRPSRKGGRRASR
jgi:AcrR family transcriptional regulator